MKGIIVKLILENWKEVGIDIKTQNIEGKTALYILHLEYQNEQNDIVTMLEEEYSKMDSSEPAFKRHKKDWKIKVNFDSLIQFYFFMS